MNNENNPCSVPKKNLSAKDYESLKVVLINLQLLYDFIYHTTAVKVDASELEYRITSSINVLQNTLKNQIS